MPVAQEGLIRRILELREIRPWDHPDSGENGIPSVVDTIRSILSDPALPCLPLLQQQLLFDYIEYLVTVTGSTVSSKHVWTLASNLHNAFSVRLRKGNAPVVPLIRLYDILYTLYFYNSSSAQQMKRMDEDLTIPFSRYLRDLFRDRPVPPPQHQSDKQIRLCYLLQHTPLRDGNAMADVLLNLLIGHRELRSKRFKIYVYSWKYADPEFLKRIESPDFVVRCFHMHPHLENLDALKASFLRDRIDVAITDANTGVPTYLFESRVAPIQIFFQGGPPFWSIKELDAAIFQWHMEPSVLGMDARKCFRKTTLCFKSWRFREDVDAARVKTERDKFPASRRIVGFYGRLVKVTPEYLHIVKSILDLNQDVVCVLAGPGDPAMIRNFIAEHNLHHRLFLVHGLVDGPNIYSNVLDVFLDTFPQAGGYSCYEALCRGKPVVHMPSEDIPNTNAQWRDPSLLAGNKEAYIQIVNRLLSDEAFYTEACRRARQIAAKSSSRLDYAQEVEQIVEKVLRQKRPDR